MGTETPNLFIVGAAKSATTTIYIHLQKHEDIFFSEVKEPKYLSRPYKEFPMRGPGDDVSEKEEISSKEVYFDLFSNRKEKYLGEASVDYLYYYHTAKEIHNLNPKAKIIICIRNPVDRAYSAYWHLKNDEREALSFEDALKEEENRIKNNYEFIWHYKNAGLYYEQVKAYIETFGKENVHILMQEEISQDIKGSINNILEFLGLGKITFEIDNIKNNPSGIPKSKIINKFVRNQNQFKNLLKFIVPKSFRQKVKAKILSKNYTKTTMDQKIRSQLTRYYTDDIKELEHLINKDLSKWYQL
ncbi:sulfotransferase domain-containing protein [Thalassobacillus hwangdonensis]|uniref:Sulfotransferase domain-containing protein n=1 Tax=Thalassobacillus hwangdonensis TaxID=546108 RepID=A0ABW3L2H6_9BACI